MPDYQGIMSDADMQAVGQWFNVHWKGVRCPVTNDENWNIEKHVVKMSPYTPGFGQQFGGTVYP